jgi:hypothetical protein
VLSIYSCILLFFRLKGKCPTHFSYLSLNGDYFLKQHYLVDLCNDEVWCSL